MRFVIVCGGTGGHFYPGYALGKVLRARGHQTLFVLRTDDPAAGRLEAEDLPSAELELRGMPRGLSARWFTFPWMLLRSLLAARNILRSYAPQAVVGMGGYLTFPIAFAARRSRIPYVLHESNALLGLANRLCAGGAYALALGLPLCGGAGATRSVLTGTPVREELYAGGEPGAARESLGLDPHRRTVLVFGGSQGASAINRFVPSALRECARRQPGGLQVVHLTGLRDEQSVLQDYRRGAGELKWTVLAYAQDMAPAYAAADLVISRSGASTLSELAAQRKPVVLVPYPHAAAGHQTVNARVLAQAGAAEVLEESALGTDALTALLAGLLDGRETLAAMAASYDRLTIPAAAHSAAALADLVEEAAAAQAV
ncbi:MAG: UDP-N-acetylglucosamine--N-acetylmuramyl-(pentapeptide) pyrophosphoryl-undecaprenol N-acetylglucosamine transferase [Elusimicrobiota bacterium]